MQAHATRRLLLIDLKQQKVYMLFNLSTASMLVGKWEVYLSGDFTLSLGQGQLTGL